MTGATLNFCLNQLGLNPQLSTPTPPPMSSSSSIISGSSPTFRTLPTRGVGHGLWTSICFPPYITALNGFPHAQVTIVLIPAYPKYRMIVMRMTPACALNSLLWGGDVERNPVLLRLCCDHSYGTGVCEVWRSMPQQV